MPGPRDLLRTTPLLMAAVGTFITLLVGIALSRLAVDWGGWQQATCMPDGCFCEHVRLGSVRQPSNTWSNAGMVFAGYLVLALGWADRRAAGGAPVVSPAATATYGLAIAIAGIGSGFFHASLTFAGQWVDVVGMYLTASFVLIYAIAAMRRWSPGLFVGAYIGINVAGGISLVVVPELRRWVFGILVALAVAAEVMARRRVRGPIDGRLLVAAVAVLALSFTIWILDLTKVLCIPESLAQGHALWHLLCATSAALVYAYYRSERAAIGESLKRP